MTRVESEAGGALRQDIRARASGILLVSRALVARAISIAAAAALSVTVARVLGPAQAGMFFVVMAIVIGAATLGRWGTDNMALKWVATASDHVGSRAPALLWICAASSAIAAVPLYGFMYWVLESRLPAESVARAAFIASVAIIPVALSVTSGAILRAVGKVASGTIAELGSPLAIASVALLALSSFGHSGIVAAISALALGYLLTAAWSLPLAARQVSRDSTVNRARETIDVARGHWRQMSSMMGSSLLFYTLTWAPVLVLGAVSSASEVAYFNVAARIAAFIALIPSIQTSYLTPQFALLHHRGQLQNLNTLVQTSTRRAVAFGTLLAAPILIFPAQALLLFGSDFAAGQDALRALTLAAVLVVALGPVNGLLLTCGFEHFASLLNAISLVIAGVAMLLIAPSGGAFGVAVVSGSVSLGYAAAAAWRMRSTAGIVAHIDVGVSDSQGPSDGRASAGPTVLVVAGQFATSASDTWLIDDLVEALVAEGAVVDVVVYDAANPRPRGFQETHTGARVFSVGPERPSRRGPDRLFRHLGTAVRLHTASRRFLASEPYDICVYFSPAIMSGGLPAALRRKGRVKHLVFVLWDFFPIHHGEIGRIKNRALLRPLKMLERRALARADTIAVMSPRNGEFLRTYHRGLASATMTVPPWGGNDTPPPAGMPKFDDFTVVFGGQLTAGRGVEILIDAAALLQDSHDHVRFLIIGSGPDRDRLEDLAAHMKLDNLEFRDRVKRTEYLQLLQRVHVGVAVTVPNVSVPSYPSKVVDYFRMGVPAIVCLEQTTDAGGIIEASGAGLAVAAGDPTQLADAIAALCAEHEAGELVRRSAHAREFYEHYLSAQSAARALLSLRGAGTAGEPSAL